MSAYSASDQECTDRRLSDSDAFNLLSDQRRRELISVLESTGPTTVSELVARLSDRTGEPSDRILVSLVHCHLPKLEDYGVVTLDGETVRVGAKAPELRRYRVADRR